MGLRKDFLTLGAIMLGIGVVSLLPENQKGTSTNYYEEDDDLFMNSWDEENEDDNRLIEENFYNTGRELPDGYVELYNGSMAKLSEVDDIDDLADPSDYYR